MCQLRKKTIYTAFQFLAMAGVIFISQQRSFGQILPGLEGEDLVTAIQNTYTPQQLLNDTQAKDTLYAKIFIEGDTVRCIYSDLPRFLPEGIDPSQFLFRSGNEIESINLEHGWPQAKGAGDGTNGNVNMHHLYPSRVAINSDRANFPFSEINNNATQKWYYLNQEMSMIPSNQIEAYSEYASGSFEPRENAKGDLARAMFYFWTIYRNDAIAADPDFFNLQVDDLCTWHELDPVDDFEILRNERIAFYQDGKINPFVVDCSLVKRAYCNQLQECTVSISTESNTKSAIFFDSAQQKFQIRNEGYEKWNFYIVNMMGRIIYKERVFPLQWSNSIEIPPGFYIAFASKYSEKISTRFYIPK